MEVFDADKPFNVDYHKNLNNDGNRRVSKKFIEDVKNLIKENNMEICLLDDKKPDLMGRTINHYHTSPGAASSDIDSYIDIPLHIRPNEDMENLIKIMSTNVVKRRSI